MRTSPPEHRTRQEAYAKNVCTANKVPAPPSTAHSFKMLLMSTCSPGAVRCKRTLHALFRPRLQRCKPLAQRTENQHPRGSSRIDVGLVQPVLSLVEVQRPDVVRPLSCLTRRCQRPRLDTRYRREGVLDGKLHLRTACGVCDFWRRHFGAKTRDYGKRPWAGRATRGRWLQTEDGIDHAGGNAAGDQA